MCLVDQSCLALWDPMDYSSPGPCAHGIFQARILEWVAISSSRGSSQPRDWTFVSCIAGGFFTCWALREAWYTHISKHHTLNIYNFCLSVIPQYLAFQVLVVKNPRASTGGGREQGLIPGWGRSPGEGNGNSLCHSWYSCLENLMDRGAWRATVHGVTKSQTRQMQLHMHTQYLNTA